jgi:hypothetical protein
VEEIFVFICNNARDLLSRLLFRIVKVQGENLLCPFRQCSGDPKVKDNAGNLQFYDKSPAGRKIKNSGREYL